MTRRYLLPIVVLVALTAPASAAQVTLTDTWQSLGTGPLSISVLNGDGLFEASATAPTDIGQPIFRNQNPYPFNSTLTIWGKRRSSASSPIAVTSPISVGGGGSGGGGSGGAITAPLGSNTKANSVSVTYATDQLLPAFATNPTVSVSNFPTTQAVSGTVAATQSGAYTVTQGPAGTAKWLVDGSGVTQPVSNGGTFAVQNNAATPTGTNSIGTVGLNAGTNAIGSITNTSFAATQSGTWSVNATLQAGTAIAGKFGIDQTTPGTTNKVSLGSDVVTTNQTQQAGTALGAPTAYGTAPTGNVIGTNTNVLASVLPTGAATSAAQTTGNNSLATIATNTTGAATAANQVPLVYTLLSNFTTNGSGTAQVVNGGGYYLNISGTFGGATVTITTTVNGVATSSTYTSAVSALSLNVGAGTTVQASVSGGTSASITATLNGFGPAVGSGGASTTAQGAGGTNPWSVYEAGSALASAGIVPAVSASATFQIGKTSAGNLYSAYAIATAANTAQAYLVCIDATAAPAAGATITPKDFAAFSSNSIGAVANINFGSGPPEVYTTGITCLASTSLTTYTAAATSALNVRAR